MEVAFLECGLLAVLRFLLGAAWARLALIVRLRLHQIAVLIFKLNAALRLVTDELTGNFAT